MPKEPTPMRRQYLRIKQRYPEAILLFRLGDFYEAFDEDARLVSREAEIALTSREMGKGQRAPMAGIPHHALHHYLGKLVSKGYKVAICEQLSPPGQGLVEREVVRVVTPGTLVEPGLLTANLNNYLVAVASGDKEVGIAYADITTGEFATTQVETEAALPQIERLNPAEVLTHQDCPLPLPPVPVTRMEEEYFELEAAQERLLEHFGAASLEAFGCAHLPQAVRAAGAILNYLARTQQGALACLTRLATSPAAGTMVVDPAVFRHLEVFHSLRPGQPSLLSVLDLTRTAMGGRLLRRWLSQPLLDLDELNRRQDAVEGFCRHHRSRSRVALLLAGVADLERLTSRARSGLITPRELLHLRDSLRVVPEMRELLEPPLDWLAAELKPCPEVVELIDRAVSEAEGELINPGFSPELDGIREGARRAKEYLATLERRERERSGIKSLKVGYNQVFGYYIEVTRPNLPRLPPDYIRKQTLVGAERFITPELKEYESLILHAKERIEEVEGMLFRQVCQQVAAHGESLLTTARGLAQIDVLAALAEVAVRYHYVRPQLNHGDAILIKGGRHPVVERSREEPFIPNDTFLSGSEAQLIVLTGPNMSGKSTYIRQVGLMVLLAQVGSFVPAESATLGLVDRLFTRVGLMDEIAAGQSTFMVEMMETAYILHQATPRSLIILDEIGRGTSTYDGISIARAVAEYIHNHPRIGAKTLFATHYHELVELARYLPRVKNYNVAVMEEGGRVVFLHRIVPGGSDRSYGIHVAQLAGMPRAVVHRAGEVLRELEGDRREPRPRRPPPPSPQLPLFPPPSPVEEELSQLDIDSLTPLEAIMKLYELKKKARKGD